MMKQDSLFRPILHQNDKLHLKAKKIATKLIALLGLLPFLYQDRQGIWSFPPHQVPSWDFCIPNGTSASVSTYASEAFAFAKGPVGFTSFGGFSLPKGLVLCPFLSQGLRGKQSDGYVRVPRR
jgi:hypothetical protein